MAYSSVRENAFPIAVTACIPLVLMGVVCVIGAIGAVISAFIPSEPILPPNPRTVIQTVEQAGFTGVQIIDVHGAGNTLRVQAAANRCPVTLLSDGTKLWWVVRDVPDSTKRDVYESITRANQLPCVRNETNNRGPQ